MKLDQPGRLSRTNAMQDCTFGVEIHLLKGTATMGHRIHSTYITSGSPSPSGNYTSLFRYDDVGFETHTHTHTQDYWLYVLLTW